jgi:hypothetical protein
MKLRSEIARKLIPAVAPIVIGSPLMAFPGLAASPSFLNEVPSLPGLDVVVDTVDAIASNPFATGTHQTVALPSILGVNRLGANKLFASYGPAVNEADGAPKTLDPVLILFGVSLVVGAVSLYIYSQPDIK